MQPTEATDLIRRPLNTRRHQDPPRLWWRMGMMSLLLHGMLLAFLFPLLRITMARSGGQQGTPVDVEVIDTSEINWAAVDAATAAAHANTANPPDTPVATAPAAPPPAAPAAPVTLPFSPSDFIPTSPPGESPPADTTLPPEGTPPQTTPPENTPPQATPPENTPLQNAPPQTTLPENTPPTGPTQPPFGQGAPPGGGIGEITSPPITGDPLPEAPPDISTPPPGDGGSGTNTDLPTTPVEGGPAGTSPGYTASLSATALPLPDARDIPDIPASPTSSSIDISTNPLDPSSCPFSAGLDASLGIPVQMNVVVEVNGRVSNIASVDTGAVSPDYLDFVQCVVRKVSFVPASSEGSQVASNVIVTVSVTRN